jgi:AsmA protein
LALNTAFSFTNNGLSLSELAMRLDETTINGAFSLQQNALTEWQLDVDIDSLDVDRYLAEAEPVANSTANDDAALPIPVELIRSLSGSGSLEIGSLQVAGLSLADLSVNVQAADGRISLSPLSSNLYQGSFNGSMSLDASQPLPTMGVNVALQEIAIDPLLTDMLDAAMVSGTGSVQLDVRSAGADSLALRQGLTGTGSINLQDGILQGVDVASVLNQLETMLRSRSAGQFSRGEQTAFDSFTANLQIDNGVINSNDLLIQSPGFQVTGNGTLLNLHNDSINYNLLTSVTAGTATRNDQEFDVGGYDVPIACSGTISAPRCLPDAGEIFRTAFANEVRDRVGDLLRRATGTDQAEATAADDNGNTDQADPAEQLINRALDRLLPN